MIVLRLYDMIVATRSPRHRTIDRSLHSNQEPEKKEILSKICIRQGVLRVILRHPKVLRAWLTIKIARIGPVRGS